MNELLLVMSVLLSFLVLLEAWSFQQKKLKRTMEKNLFWNPEHCGKEGTEGHVQGQMFGGAPGSSRCPDNQLAGPMAGCSSAP